MPDWLMHNDKNADDTLEKHEQAADDLLEGLGAGMDDEPELRF